MLVSFTRPVYLTFLFAIPILILIHFITIRTRRSYALRFSNFEAVARIRGIDLFSKNLTILIISCLNVSLIVLALSGFSIQRDMYASSFSYVLAIDSSRSMEATDFNPSRIDAAKENSIKFINKAGSGLKAGVVSFSGNAFIEKEISDDMVEVKQSINDITLSKLGGTDILDAVVASTNLLMNEKNRAIIILSDGQFNVGDIDEAINYAKKNDVVIFTIGIGTERGGETSFGLSTLEQDSLRAVAYNTNGKYFLAQNGEELTEAFNDIILFKFRNVTIDMTYTLLMIAVFILVFEFWLINTRYKILP